MPTRKSTVKQSGGGGFEFADKVAAFFLANMLAGSTPLGSKFGPISEIHFEVRDLGWLLDDLLIESDFNESKHRCAISLKSNSQVTQSGFPPEFVSAVWDHLRHVERPEFDSAHDLFALGVARVSNTVKTAWDQLLGQAIEAEPDRMLLRLRDEGQSSELQRALFSSLNCPPAICGDGANDLETASLLRSIRLLVWDFESEPSTDEASAIDLCKSLLKRPDIKTAIALWLRLQKVAAQGRTNGSTHRMPTLVGMLKSDFELKEHPNFESDLEALRAFSEESRGNVKSIIGQGVRIPRKQVETSVIELLKSKPIVVLRGDSGCGKSAIAANIAAAMPKDEPLIWLDGTQYDNPGQTALSQSLHLQHTIPEVIDAMAAQTGLVIFDAFESFSPNAIRRVGELIKVATAAKTKLRLLLTCQSSFWEAALRALIGTGTNPTDISAIDIAPPPVNDIITALLPEAPRVASLFFRPELQDILSNLKVLDWVVIEDALRSDAGSTTFVRESDLIDWIWDRWVGTSPAKYARADLLKTIAERDGNAFGSPMYLQEFGNDEQRTLGELEKDHLLRIKAEAVTFAHDLMGDWARLHCLLSERHSVIEKIGKVSSAPRWHRAVRLYAQRMLERDNGPLDWKQSIEFYQKDKSQNILAIDSFLDALIFAGSAEQLLDQVWPQLTSNKGELLSRFLKRFLHVATVPDLRIAAYTKNEDTEWVLNRYRIPLPLLWHGPLRILNKHSDDVSRLTPILAADLCELWLRTIPDGFVGHSEAAKLAISVAREVQAQRAEWDNHHDTKYKKVFEALFQAAREFPDEVTQISLELCHRRDESADITARVLAFKERLHNEELKRIEANPPDHKKRASFPPFFERMRSHRLREPAIDGPRKRVDESFRVAAMDTSAIVPLVRYRPAAAREVILAVCIDEPKPIDFDNGLLREFGITSYEGDYPPCFFRGPFLHFLRVNAEEGLATIIRLVNYATDRWSEHYFRNAPPDVDRSFYSLKLSLPTGTTQWHGLPDAFLWYRDINTGSHSVVSALMALEKWLYDEVDQGRSIDPWIEQIFRQSSSAAFAGLLVSAGIRTPRLFIGSLRPLLAVWQVYYLQMELATQDDTWRIGMTSWARFGEEIYQQVVQWNTMPHRKRLLRDTAQELFLSVGEVRHFFDNQRSLWAAEIKGDSNEELEMLIAIFDSQNYSQRAAPEDKIHIEFEWPEPLRTKLQAKQLSGQVKTSALLFPYKCRRILSGEEVLNADDVEKFWVGFQNIVKELSDKENDDGEPTRKNTISAGIAVLATFHGQWLDQNSEAKQWCLQQLNASVDDKWEKEYSSISHSEKNSESFFGEAAFALIPEVEELWLREVAAAGVLGYYYSSTRLVLAQVFRLRERLKDDFVRTINLMMYWSALRAIRSHAERLQQPTDRFDRMKVRLISAFAKRTLSAKFVSLDRIRRLSERAFARLDALDKSPWRQSRRHSPDDQTIKVERGGFYVDTEVISKGFSFLGSVRETKGPDRETLLNYCFEVLALFLSTMPTLETGQELEGTPYDFDRWILRLCAETIPNISSAPTARQMWEPIMRIGPGARYWMEDFFHSWFLYGLQASPSVETFGIRWKELITYAGDSPAWAPEQRRGVFFVEDCTRELMGIGLTVNMMGRLEYVQLFKSLAGDFEKWAHRWLSWPESTVAFSHFLSKPAGIALLPDGIIWLNSAVRVYSNYQWREQYIDDSLSGALRACWKSFSKEVGTNRELRIHFLELLNTLCKRLAPDALALRTQVSTFIAEAGA